MTVNGIQEANKEDKGANSLSSTSSSSVVDVAALKNADEIKAAFKQLSKEEVRNEINCWHIRHA